MINRISPVAQNPYFVNAQPMKQQAVGQSTYQPTEQFQSLNYEQSKVLYPEIQKAPLTNLDKKFCLSTKLEDGGTIALPTTTRDDCYYKIAHTNIPSTYVVRKVLYDSLSNPNHIQEYTIDATIVKEENLKDFLPGMQTITRIDSNTFLLDTPNGQVAMNKEGCEQFLNNNRLYLPTP